MYWLIFECRDIYYCSIYLVYLILKWSNNISYLVLWYYLLERYYNVKIINFAMDKKSKQANWVIFCYNLVSYDGKVICKSLLQIIGCLFDVQLDDSFLYQSTTGVKFYCLFKMRCKDKLWRSNDIKKVTRHILCVFTWFFMIYFILSVFTLCLLLIFTR